MEDHRAWGGEDDDELDEGPSAEDIARFGEVTVTCPECGTELFDDVAICWKCGHAVGTPAGRSHTPAWAAAVAVLIILGFILVYLAF